MLRLGNELVSDVLGCAVEAKAVESCWPSRNKELGSQTQMLKAGHSQGVCPQTPLQSDVLNSAELMTGQ